MEIVFKLLISILLPICGIACMYEGAKTNKFGKYFIGAVYHTISIATLVAILIENVLIK